MICVGTDAAYIAAAAADAGFNGENIHVFKSDDYEKAASLLLSLVKEGDTVLFKASNRTNIRKVMEASRL